VTPPRPFCNPAFVAYELPPQSIMTPVVTRPHIRGLVVLMTLASPFGAAAQERLCDPQFEDCRAPIIDLIRNERVGIDVAFWFMEDARYNYNWFRLVESTSSNPTTPYGGTPVALPGLVQVENFDIGAEGGAFYDTTTGNTAGCVSP
jgi:hypothetical protein